MKVDIRTPCPRCVCVCVTVLSCAPGTQYGTSLAATRRGCLVCCSCFRKAACRDFTVCCLILYISGRFWEASALVLFLEAAGRGVPRVAAASSVQFWAATYVVCSTSCPRPYQEKVHNTKALSPNCFAQFLTTFSYSG